MNGRQYRKAFVILIAVLLAAGAALYLCPSEADPWDEMYPFWGERPGEQSYSVNHHYGNVTFPVHVIIEEKEWVSQQLSACVSDSPNDVDASVAMRYPHHHYKVWRSRETVDFAGTRYQAVQPTYIVMDSGDCLIYLYDWYNMCTRDALPPPAKVLEPRFEK